MHENIRYYGKVGINYGAPKFCPRNSSRSRVPGKRALATD